MFFIGDDRMKLSERLQMVAGLIRPGRPVADIGTDHAYLPVYLLLGNRIPRALACDLREGPLQNAKQTVERYGFSDKVGLILSDGLKALAPGCVNDFVIAGMGGNLIADILAASNWVLDTDNHFVLQPQSHAEDLREYLVNSGFEILREVVCREGRHLYLAMEVIYTGKIKEYPITYYYLGELPNSESELRDEYIDFIYDRLKVRRDALVKSNNDDGTAKMLDTVLKKIEEIRSGEYAKD